MNKIQNIKKNKNIFCDEGHPKVYLYLDEKIDVAFCYYCGKKFLYTNNTNKNNNSNTLQN